MRHQTRLHLHAISIQSDRFPVGIDRFHPDKQKARMSAGQSSLFIRCFSRRIFFNNFFRASLLAFRFRSEGLEKNFRFLISPNSPSRSHRFLNFLMVRSIVSL